MTVAGKRCKGNWTEWTACEGCGNRTRTFIIPGGAEEADAPSGEQPGAEPQAQVTRRHLQAAGNKGRGNSNEDGNKGHQSEQSRPGSLWQPSFGAPAPGQQRPGVGQAQGLAHAFGLGHGLALALGHIECAVLNNTVEAQACTETCPGYCAGAPEASTGSVAFAWPAECGSGNYNDTSCAGTCSDSSQGLAGVADAFCSNSTYVVTYNCTSQD